MTKAKGDLNSITTEAVGIISLVYKSIKEQDVIMADVFKRTVQAAMLDPMSPVFMD